MEQQRRPEVTRTTGALAVVAYCVLVAGANLPNALGPLHAQRFGLDALAQAVLFSSYVLALVAALVVAASPLGAPLRRLPAVGVLGLAVVTALASDALLVLGVAGPGWLLAGRVLGGVAVGLATGATATTALAGLGERARTTVAFGAIAGALAGSLAGGALGTWADAPEVESYVGHLVLLAGLGAALLVSVLRPSAQRSATRPGSSSSPVVVGGYRARHRSAGFLLGAMAWSAAGVVLAVLPAGVRAVEPSASLLEAALPCAVFLAAAWAAQAWAGRRLLHTRAWQVALPLVGGAVLMAVALQASSLPLLLAAAALCGAGQGPAYGLGLVTVTHGLGPAEQGRTSSRYAAVAYSACGVTTLLVGALAASSGVVGALAALAAALAASGVAAAALAGPRQQVVGGLAVTHR